ncbi:FecR family protein [Puteibacter caeruleilacunae]|nr:FecR family protein [Puteibacter caeruleilacunae]
MLENEKIEILISGYFENSIDDTQRRMLEDWRDKSDNNRNEFERLSRIHQEQKRHVSSNQLLAARDRMKGQVISQLITKNKKTTRGFSAALSFCVVLIVGLMVGDISLISNNNQIYSGDFIVQTEPGQISTCILPDGTVVWLNSGSEVRYRFANYEERQIELRGEAFFEVAKSEATPFIVETTSGKVKVFGTKFNVRARKDEQNVLITLAEGSIGVLNKEDELLVKMVPNEQVGLSSKGTIASQKKVDASIYGAWKESRFLYKNANLEFIAQRFSEFYGVTVAFESEHLKKETFRCVLDRKQSMLKALQMLKRTSDIDYKVSGTKIIFKEK